MEPKKPKEPLKTDDVKDFLKQAENDVKKGKPPDFKGFFKKHLKP